MVYFLERQDGALKIGATEVLRRRLETLSRAHGALPVMGVQNGAHAEESALHRRFAASHLSGEWLQKTPELADYIAEHTTPWDPSWDETRDRQNIKFDKVLAKKAKVMASEKGLDVSSFVEDLLREPLQREWDAGWERLATPGAPTQNGA